MKGYRTAATLADYLERVRARGERKQRKNAQWRARQVREMFDCLKPRAARNG